MDPLTCLQKTRFLLSVAELKQLPADIGSEIAFAGRSNAGKSSAINVITGLKSLARTSKTPGCTQLLNFFVIDDEHRIVDLPGYGYAKVPEAIKQRWQKTLELYFAKRNSLRGLILISDIRHPLREFDRYLLSWANQQQLPVHVLLSKADKLSRGAAKTTLLQAQQTLQEYTTSTHVQLFSALNRTGVAEARSLLLEWLSLSSV